MKNQKYLPSQFLIPARIPAEAADFCGFLLGGGVGREIVRFCAGDFPGWNVPECSLLFIWYGFKTPGKTDLVGILVLPDPVRCVRYTRGLLPF